MSVIIKLEVVIGNYRLPILNNRIQNWLQITDIKLLNSKKGNAKKHATLTRLRR